MTVRSPSARTGGGFGIGCNLGASRRGLGASSRGGLEELVRAALDRVLDPELDEPITDLGFVTEVTAGDDGGVLVRLRLPTYFCAPNFAYLMVADSFEAARGVPGVARAEVRLDDHFAAEEINAGVLAGAGFGSAFPGLAEDDLEQFRLTFWRKAHLAEQERVATRLLRAGHALAELARCNLGDVHGGDRLRRHRKRLGLAVDADAPLIVDEEGNRIEVDDLPMRLRLARTTRVSIEGNAGLCRGLLATRYPRG